LRLSKGVQISDILENLSLVQQEHFITKAAWLQDQGFIIQNDGRIFLTPKGFVLENEVAVNLFPE